MSVNLVDLLKEQFNDKAVDHLGLLLGENPVVVRKALTGILPAVVGGVAHHIKDPDAPTSLLALLQTTPASERLTDTFTDPARTQTAYATGEPLLARIFGTKTQSIVSALASYSGAKATSITSLLQLTAATLLSLLNQQLTGSAQTATGLTALMEGQADTVGKAMPVALSGLLSLIGIEVVNTETTNLKHAEPIIPAPLAATPTTGTPWLRWLLLALGLILLLLLLRTCLTDKKTTGTVVATDTTSAAAPVNSDTVASATSPAVQVDVELPGGRRLKVAERSFNANLAGYLAEKPKAPFRTFTFDNLNFDTNSAAITGESQTHVNDLIEIMKAYPALVIKIEGHTDNTGSEATNETLSQERADAVKAALVKAGIKADRVSTKGYAAEKPTATNQTSEGRHENRRIDVVVIKA